MMLWLRQRWWEKPDPVKGEEICSYVILKEGFKPSPRLKHLLRQHVREEIGPVASLLILVL
jgi:acetyl-CoA synthetase